MFGAASLTLLMALSRWRDAARVLVAAVVRPWSEALYPLTCCPRAALGGHVFR